MWDHIKINWEIFGVHSKLYTPIQHSCPYTLHPHPYTANVHTPNNQSIDVGIREAWFNLVYTFLIPIWKICHILVKFSMYSTSII
jgi:hypothetical protein